MKQSTLSSKKTVLLLSLIILAQLAYITYTFGWQREGWHSDETWSYGYANAWYQPQLYYDDETLNRTNFDTWTSGHIFRNYIEVQDGQQFSYGSVAHNMSQDLNPPLHSLLLHTICSFFPDNFSWWYAYIINILSFIAAIISLYFLGKELTHSQKTALFICFYYGILSGALSTFIYLRCYAMLTAIAILYAYFHCKLYNTRFQKPLPCLAGIFLLNIIGGLSHYYFLAFAFCFAVVFFIWQIVTKQFKTAGLYTAVMAVSVGIVFLLWPHTIDLITRSPNMYAEHMPLYWEIKICFHFLAGEAAGFIVHYMNTFEIAVFNVCLLFLAIIAAGLSVLFRNETWFRSGIKKTLQKIKHWFCSLPGRFKHMDKKYLFLGIICSATLIIIAKISNIYLMGIYSDRYLFFLMPVTAALFVAGIRSLIRRIFKKFSGTFRTGVVIVLTITGIVCNYVFFPCHYLFTSSDDAPPVWAITEDANVIVVMTDDWHLVYYSTLLRDCQNFYAVNTSSCMDALQSVNKLEDDSDSPVYLIVENNRLRNDEDAEALPDNVAEILEEITYDYTLSDVVNKMASAEFATMSKFCTRKDCFFGTYEIYQLR